ncbi:MAG: putative manganese-dependent inorganic diphosphatase [Bacillota bacterium]
MDNNVIIIGHQKPDLDSIASAMGYAALKNKLHNGGFVAARAGAINRETEFVLNYFNLSVPQLVEDLHSRAKDILDGGLLYIQPKATLRQAGLFMRQHGVNTLAVVDNNGVLVGIFTIGDLAKLFLDAWDTGLAPMEQPLHRVMKRDNLVVFHEDDLLTDVKKTMLETRYRNYPVVDENFKLLGLIARFHLLSARGKQVILVDHNEQGQAVPGIGEANTIEIIDHHRVADIQTAEPIMVRNEPVGSTATIIAKIYRENGLEPEKAIAGLLCAAILSDTLLFKSPTSTSDDQRQAAWLAEIAGIAIKDFGKEMFKATSTMVGRTAREIVLEDFKNFVLNEYKVGIGQTEIINPDALSVTREELQAELEQVRREREHDLGILIITDLLRDGSELHFAGPVSKGIEMAFNIPPGEKMVFLPGVMSRKKQVVPPLQRWLQK